MLLASNAPVEDIIQQAQAAGVTFALQDGGSVLFGPPSIVRGLPLLLRQELSEYRLAIAKRLRILELELGPDWIEYYRQKFDPVPF